MKKSIIAKDIKHLKRLIKNKIKTKGNQCDLNYIDVSDIADMSKIFQDSPFNGDISKWDISNVRDMQSMFENSLFNGDISNWDTSSVENMRETFKNSKFNGDISKWNVSNVKDMHKMFSESEFNGDISKWDVSKVEKMDFIFSKSNFLGVLEDWTPYKLNLIHPIRLFGSCLEPIVIPYWANFKDTDTRFMAIKAYHLKNGLIQELSVELNMPITKRLKL